MRQAEYVPDVRGGQRLPIFASACAVAVLAFSTLTLFVGPAAGRAAGLGPSPGGWLLDHGRTLGVNTTCPTTDDAELVLVWMEAAARVDPDDAHLCRKTLHNFRMKMSEAEEQGTLTYGALFDEIVRAIVKD